MIYEAKNSQQSLLIIHIIIINISLYIQTFDHTFCGKSEMVKQKRKQEMWRSKAGQRRAVKPGINYDFRLKNWQFCLALYTTYRQSLAMLQLQVDCKTVKHREILALLMAGQHCISHFGKNSTRQYEAKLSCQSSV